MTNFRCIRAVGDVHDAKLAALGFESGVVGEVVAVTMWLGQNFEFAARADENLQASGKVWLESDGDDARDLETDEVEAHDGAGGELHLEGCFDSFSRVVGEDSRITMRGRW